MASSSHVPRKYELDCQCLHCYFSGNDAINKQKLVEILTSRSAQELKLIRQTYSALYSQDLLHVISNAGRNNPFSRAVYLRISESQERDAETIRNALYGGSLNLNTLIETVCTRPSLELQSIKQAYRSRYNSDIEQDVALKINGGFKEILLAVLKSSHNYGAKVDISMAMCDAKTLYEAMESGMYIDQKTIISLLSQRTTGQLKAIFASYKQLYGHEFSKSLKQNKCGQFGKELCIVIRCVQYPEKFFAKQLRTTLKYGDAREILTRIVVTRSEIDIKGINSVFAAKTGCSIATLVRREFNTSGSHYNNNKSDGLVAEFLVGLLKCC
ncbi:hypothetical protein HHK36_008068 [Tetracentron sinense]|uniref:Annexin n=1 Tax=Tetracentron sinense TaxID=13715 RepID=A0A835DJK3_TETSI|nr:hypothetical protein HHK36_008068 [Tetracentron sinense]